MIILNKTGIKTHTHIILTHLYTECRVRSLMHLRVNNKGFFLNQKEETKIKNCFWIQVCQLVVFVLWGLWGCNTELCNRLRLGHNAAQKAVLLWSDVSSIVHSCASLSLQAAFLLTSWWQASQYPWLERKGFTHTHTHTLGRGFHSFAVPLSLFLNS